ncbi:arginine/ornithine antiporter protein [Chlamydia pneumoniae TW-183]|uniref:Arginine/agmatine antiporter n=4 Tax=Chlamydia pneumoniae TaxID=83558 RepID=AAXC_CHLPN|nr:arginine/agmatine antiporter AaxC [Chlamydia pneumoniae]Q9Z6M8.2 RecName: Full=Arginine/agmatine antiporter [Chlamydia pneumoniae]AAF73708.1 amino acid permease [Chlamydia pneumoniae AR39]AAP99000.1 arginine/ornithine antiporter protein [Chlamydia pneumoniae TW-183]CRI36439.1 Arginine/agmatine antiporter [Chlamydia pneumoniae]CRI42085.1 Arginine/agmatine antiporter [Chlamydia pneumoniae]CRI52234.1 Arginine/agmatine antiporter [Chlamydia pneumoniae]
MTSRTKSSKNLGTIALAGMVVSSIIGGGIFSLPQNMAATAGAGAVILSWILTGFGMFFIANTFRILSTIRPDLKEGIYMYSREGFGPYIGFTIGWGYWLCQIFGNVGYAVITMDALNYFFPPYFQGGNTLPAILGGSILIWVFNFIVLKGIRQASIINVIGTIFKIIPLIIFIILTAFFFKLAVFKTDFWGHAVTKAQPSLGSVSSQLKGTMLVTLWAFIGIEGAVVMSGRAKNPLSVGQATVLGFLGCLTIYILFSLLPFGSLFQHQLANIPNPSTAGVLDILVGKWGEVLMNVGLIIAVLSSWLSWTIIVAEIPFSAAKNGTFPEIFTIENKEKSPSVSLYITSSVMQLAMLLVYFSSNAWNTMLSITGVMVLPAYLASAAFLFKLSKSKTYPKKGSIKAPLAMITGILGVVYSLWLIYAGGLKYLFMALVLLALGIPFYIDAGKKKKNAKTFFAKKEIVGMTFIGLLALTAIFLFSTGRIKI